MTGMTEENLSDKIYEPLGCLSITDVREAVQKLKDFIKKDLPSPYWNVCDEIDKIFGPQLVGDKK